MGWKEAREGAGEGKRVVAVCAVWEGGWGRLEGEHGAMVGCKRTPPCATHKKSWVKPLAAARPVCMSGT